MGEVETQKRSLDIDPELRKLIRECYEHILVRLDAQEQLLKHLPAHIKKARKQREERLKRDPLADAW